MLRVRTWAPDAGGLGTEVADQAEREAALEESNAPLEPFGPNWIVAENQPRQLRTSYPEPGETMT